MPSHPDPRLNLALTLEQAGQINNAIDTYRTVTEVYPEHLPTIQTLNLCQLRHHRADRELRQQLEVIAMRSDHRVWRQWARERLVE